MVARINSRDSTERGDPRMHANARGPRMHANERDPRMNANEREWG